MITDILKNIPIPDNEYLIVGCSAGPDSMALLHYLKNNTKNKIVCTHINHNIRKESKTEEKYLLNYCKQEKIIFESTTITKYNQNNFENEARNKRYQFYEQILKKYNSHYLFLAHHGDDLIETILMKIARGSNLAGYAGIKKISKKDNYNIIRPFLDYTKQDLINYNHIHQIKYYIDKSNQDLKYTRNRYRHNILPLLKQENPNIHKQYLKYSNTLLDYLNYTEDEINQILPTIFKKNILDLNQYKQLHPFLQKNILYKILNQYYQNTPNIITEKHIQNIIYNINSQKPNLSLNLPKNLLVRKIYHQLFFIKNQPNNQQENYKILLQKTNKIDNHIITRIDYTEEDGNNICRIDSKKINLPLYIRNRKKGDNIEQKGLNGHKKIKEIFIENKVPKHIRNHYPIVVDAKDQIIWIPNLKKSKFNSQKDEFYDIILKYCEKEENDE